MSAVHLLVFFCVATGSTSFARIYHHHDLNQLGGTEVDQKKGRVVSNPGLNLSKGERNNDFETIYTESIDNNLTEPDNWRAQMKLSRKKKVWKSDKKSTKRNAQTKTRDLRNALGETLKMPEELSWKIDTSRGRSDEFQQIRQIATSKPLIETPEAIENEYKSDAETSTQIDKNFVNVFFNTLLKSGTLPKQKKDTNPEIARELEYYKGVPTEGQRLPGPDIKELIGKFKKHNDYALEDENMITSYIGISLSANGSPKPILK